MSDNLHVSKEFLAEEKRQLGQTMPKPRKNGGPYPAQTKKARRDKVFRLHFDYGYSARKIADVIKINRNTINSDITFWYSQLQKDDEGASVDDWINKMLYRLEARRTRLMERLDKSTSLDDFVLLEKMLYEVDSKIIHIMMKMQTSEKITYDRTMNMFNDWMEEHGYKERYVLWGHTLKVTSGTLENIKRLIQSDRHQKSDYDNRISDSDYDATSQRKF